MLIVLFTFNEMEVKNVLETRDNLQNKLKEVGFAIPKISEAILKLRDEVTEGKKGARETTIEIIVFPSPFISVTPRFPFYRDRNTYGEYDKSFVAGEREKDGEERVANLRRGQDRNDRLCARNFRFFFLFFFLSNPSKKANVEMNLEIDGSPFLYNRWHYTFDEKYRGLYRGFSGFDSFWYSHLYSTKHPTSCYTGCCDYFFSYIYRNGNLDSIRFYMTSIENTAYKRSYSRREM